MKEIDDQKCLEYCIGLFRMMGGWPKWKYRNEWTERVYIGCTCLMFAIQLTYMVILGYGLVFLRKYWETLGEAVEDIIVFATGEPKNCFFFFQINAESN